VRWVGLVLGVNSPGLHPVLIPEGKAKGRGRVFNGASVGSMDAQKPKAPLLDQKPKAPLLEPFSRAIMSSFRLLMLDGPEVLPGEGRG
jgi:hypothetical protein